MQIVKTHTHDDCDSKSNFNHLDGEERADSFAFVVFLVSRDCCVTLPHDAAGLSAAGL